MNKERKLIIAGNWKMNKTVIGALVAGASLGAQSFAEIVKNSI